MSSDQQFPEAVAQALGQALRDAREGQGRSIQAVASELRLTVTSLRHLEGGDWERLGAPVYVRGYLRSYGRLVDVDVSAAATEVVSSAPAGLEFPMSSGRGRYRRRSFERYRRIASYGLATALVAVPVVFVVIQAFDGSLFGGDRTDAPATIAVPAAASDEGGETVRAEGPVPMIASMTGLTTRRERVDPLPGTAAASGLFDTGFEVGSETDPGAGAPVPEAEPAAVTLELTLREASWLDIRDGEGNRLLYGTQPAGSSHSFELASGIQARVGNADAVDVVLGGEVFDLRPHMDRDVADFTVPAAPARDEG